MSKELLVTKSDVAVSLDEDTRRYSISTGTREDLEGVTLPNDEAVQVALVILRAEFARRKMGLASAPLHTVGRLLDVDLENLP